MIEGFKIKNEVGWMGWMPGLATLREYQAGWLADDIFAGAVLTTMLVPVGIAYAVASGVPGIYGLYATIVPLLAYALFGPSRIMVLGPDSSLAAIILGVVYPLSNGNPRAPWRSPVRWRSCLGLCVLSPEARGSASSLTFCPSPFAMAT
jgi:MFS superfamily sulfate permease-like transporter